MQFQKNKGKHILALINFDNKINAMTLTYAAKLGFKMRKIEVDVQKIDGLLLKIYNIVIPTFQIFNKLDES